ncbi:MAG: hypothetical protein HY314_05280 [Acidobacteria bacterium]|nr:hypothetical protein [Acidobacteriota bacterium]
MAIAPEIAARALFRADRICCVCRRRGQAVEAQLLVADREAVAADDLVVLCSDCRQKGLEEAELRARREEWLSLVAWDRIQALQLWITEGNTPLAVATSLAEILRENEEYELLALLYHGWGNHELRDKFVEKALATKTSPRAQVFLRSLQGRLSEVDPKLIQTEIERRRESGDWTQLARLQAALGCWSEAIESYCRSVSDALARGDNFSAAATLREMARQPLHQFLFETALRWAADEDQFWWEVRCLDELEWKNELREYITGKQFYVEQSGDLYLQLVFHQVTGNTQKVIELQKKILEETKTY